jgi:transcriptional regulator with GAF, ATPase, and Fis domain
MLVDTRVIAATNRDLASMVSMGTFREDLYYRISVIPIELPPLRERAEDITELATHFVEKFCAPTGRALSISETAMRLLERYSWPGNVRDSHTIERAVALENTPTIELNGFLKRSTTIRTGYLKRWNSLKTGSTYSPPG